MCEYGIAAGFGLQLALLTGRLLAVLFMLQFVCQLMCNDSAACSGGKGLLDLDQPAFVQSVGGPGMAL